MSEAQHESIGLVLGEIAIALSIFHENGNKDVTVTGDAPFTINDIESQFIGNGIMTSLVLPSAEAVVVRCEGYTVTITREERSN